LLAEEAHDG